MKCFKPPVILIKIKCLKYDYTAKINGIFSSKIVNTTIVYTHILKACIYILDNYF